MPRVLRAVDAALDGAAGRGRRRSEAAAPAADAEASDSGRTGTRPPLVPAFLRWGSWIGGDRDGNPTVTAEVTERTLRIHADHVLRGYEAVATRLSSTIAAATPAPSDPRARDAPRPRRRAAARDRSDLRPALPERAVPPAVRVHRRAAPPDAGLPDWPAGAADRPLRIGGRAGRRAGRDPGRARCRRTRTVGVGRGRRTCAGSSRRSGSTSRRSRSVSTARSIGRRSRRWRGRRRRSSRPALAPAKSRTRSGRSERSRAGSARRPSTATWSASRSRPTTFAPCSTSPGWRASRPPTARCHSTSSRCSRTRRRWRPRARCSTRSSPTTSTAPTSAAAATARR